MKITITILLISIAVLITACQTTKTTTTESVVLMDITDKSLVSPKADEIVKLYDFDKSKWNGGVFRFSDISQVSINPTQEASINAGNQWLSNEFQRKDEIKLFENSIADIITKAEQGTTSQNKSSVYLPIANELNLLSQNKSEKRILIIYSDLFENTESLSFYRKKDFEKLKTKPEQIQKSLEEQASINSLSGIEIYFIYQPGDSKSDVNFQIVSGFYKKLLEDKGAKVNISANLNF